MNDNPTSQKPKPSKLSVILTVLVVISLAMLAWPVFVTIRAKANRQDKAIEGNLRIISSGVDQYYLDRGVSSVALTDLMGSNSSQYVKTFQTVANETYPAILVQGQAVTASGIAGARTLTYGN